VDRAIDEGQVVFLDSDVVLRGSYMVVAATEVAHGEEFLGRPICCLIR